MSKLSIIIPCYNCADTLEEAVASVYTQGLEDFEIIMVDDGSTDQTRAVMEKLASIHPEIKLVFHEKNRGGGAATNTGIRKATGNLIHRLDGDNFFAPHMLGKMLTFLHEKKADGVAFHGRRFFRGKQFQKYKEYYNTILDRGVALDDLFNGSGIMLDNFIYTRDSYERAGGYHEHHGFDTLSFEVRFLSTGNTVFVCPQATIYHRQDGGEKSYFERMYEKGEASRNYYLVLEDIFFLFSQSVRREIFSWDIFKKTSLKEDRLEKRLSELYTQSPGSFFIKNYTTYLVPQGYDQYMEKVLDSNLEERITKAIYYAQRKSNYEEALVLYKEINKGPLESKILYYNLIRCFLNLSGKYESSDIEDRADILITSLSLQPQEPIFKKTPFLEKIKDKIMRD